jgi:7-cyano-7-deazaguanine reductase
VTNVILDDLVAAVRPLRMTVEGDFHVRGGISTVVSATHDKTSGARARPRTRARAGRR